MDKKRSTTDQQQSPHQKKSRLSDQYAVEEPYDLRERFRNLENPLKFIQSSNILELQKKFRDLRGDLKREQESKAEFSKSIYKKVISRDNEYNFQNEIEAHEEDVICDFNKKNLQTGNGRKADERVKREILERKFKHGDVVSMEEKKERLREESEIPFTFRHLKAIDTDKFEGLKEVEFYQLIRGEDEKGFGHSGGNDLQNANIQSYVENFKHGMISNSQYHDKISYQFLFDCDRELKFWRLENIFRDDKKTEDEVLSNCAFFDSDNVPVSQMFDFSSRNIEISDIIKFYILKKQLQTKMNMDKDNESLQEKYLEAKKRFEEMKENRMKTKNQRLPAKFIDNVAQTNGQMKEKDFEEYFVQDAKNIFDRLTHLNGIRDRIVEEEDGPTFGVMATNIGIEIGKELFKLLMLVLKGEKFLDYSEFMCAQNEQEVEKKILELIYLHFANFKEYQVNGISKVDIIQKYLLEREKNERFYETYFLRHQPPDNQRPANARGSKKK